MVVVSHLNPAGGLVTAVYDDRVFTNEMRMSQVRKIAREVCLMCGGGAIGQHSVCLVHSVQC